MLRRTESSRAGERRHKPGRSHCVVFGPWLTWAVALLILAFGPISSPAELILQAPSLSVSSGGSGAFNLTVTNNNPSGGASFPVASFAVELSLVGAPGVHFMDVVIGGSPSVPYLFASSFDQANGLTLSAVLSDSHFIATDSDFSILGFTPIAPGQSFTLAHILYQVDPGATSGPRTLSFGAATSLSDNQSPIPNLLATTQKNGSLTVNATAVPEPSTLLVTATGLGLVLLAGLTFRRAVVPCEANPHVPCPNRRFPRPGK